MGLSAAVGAASLAVGKTAQAQNNRNYFELRRYLFDTEEQKEGFDAFMESAAIPALNRIGIEPVGVFEDPKDVSPAYVLLRHKSAESVMTMTSKLIADQTLGVDGAAFLDAPADNPAYARVESSLFVAFEGMPELETPTDGVDGRVFQLRIYESPSVQTGQKKIEMFNIGEIDIFRKTGLHPVFFGEALIGDRIPNLTYMLSFSSMKEQQANWKTFVNSPEWKELSAKPEYANDKILSNITNINLVPTAYSQM
jgi:hypothetical protein